MSEFKFACPVCGQHITADSSNSGTQLECPTCFRKIVIPQAPAAGESKLILSAAQVSGPRPTSAPGDLGAVRPSSRGSLAGILGGVVLLLIGLAAAGGIYHFRDRLFRNSMSTADPETNTSMLAATTALARTVYPVPTNITWTLELTNTAIPDSRAAGSIRGMGFYCERAYLTGGHLLLRQGKGKTSDLALSIYFAAQQGEELSGKNFWIPTNRIPPVPKVVLRWKDDQDQSRNQTIAGGYALKVFFGQTNNGRIPGKLYIALPDNDNSFVAGLFEAEIRKPPPPKPPRSAQNAARPGQ